jgi:hypothetical protein
MAHSLDSALSIIKHAATEPLDVLRKRHKLHLQECRWGDDSVDICCPLCSRTLRDEDCFICPECKEPVAPELRCAECGDPI